MPEKVIAERSGHRSLNALRVYEQTSTKQKMATSKVLNSPGMSFDEAKKGPSTTISGSVSGSGLASFPGLLLVKVVEGLV